MRRSWLLCASLFCLVTAGAVDPEPPIEDPAIRAQYEALIREVRCLVCQNQTIADSNAPLAADLRREIREMMVEGASVEQVTAFLTARYGDFVLYRQPLRPATWALWAAPAVLVGLGLLVFARIVSHRMKQPIDASEGES